MSPDVIIRSMVEALKARAHLNSVEGRISAIEVDPGSMPRNLPSALVAYGGSRYEPLTGGGIAEFVLLSVYISARNARICTGPCAVLYEAISALAYNSMGLPMEGLLPVSTMLLSEGGGVSIFRLDFEARFETAAHM